MFHDRPVIGIGCFFGGAVGTQGSVFVVKIDLGDKPVSDFKDTAVPRGVVRGGGVEAGGVSGCLFSLGHGRPMASPRAFFVLSTTAVRRVTASGAAFFARDNSLLSLGTVGPTTTLKQVQTSGNCKTCKKKNEKQFVQRAGQ